MKKLAFLILLSVLMLSANQAVSETIGADSSETFWNRFRTAIERHLRRPYVWGSSGLKSFDCSGFIWRAMKDSGVLIKRTTARKLYLSLPAVEQDKEYKPGNIVFFDDLKHCGIVSNERKFYHAGSSTGTTIESFDPYWRDKVIGFRAIHVPDISRQ